MNRLIFAVRRGNWRANVALAILVAISIWGAWSLWPGTSNAVPKTPSEALVAACPGIEKFATDVTLSTPVLQRAVEAFDDVRAGDNTYSIVATVGQTPSPRVASDFKALGQLCYFDISADLKTVAVTKRPCMSLCANSTEAWTGAMPRMAVFRIGEKPVFLR